MVMDKALLSRKMLSALSLERLCVLRHHLEVLDDTLAEVAAAVVLACVSAAVLHLLCAGLTTWTVPVQSQQMLANCYCHQLYPRFRPVLLLHMA
jgi:hypothetical protein